MRRMMCLFLTLSTIFLILGLGRIAQAQAKAGSVTLYFPAVSQYDPLLLDHIRLNTARYNIHHLVGEIRNTSRETLLNVGLEVRVFVSDTLTRTYNVKGLLPAVFSGQTMPFEAATDLNPFMPGLRYDVRVLTYDRDLGPNWQPLSVLTVHCDGEHYISGTVLNDSDFTLTDIRMLNDHNDGKFSNATPEQNELASGETMQYSGLAFYGCPPFGLDPGITVWAQGRVKLAP